MGCACIPVPLASPSRGASPEGRPTAAGRQVGRAGLRAEESERCFSFLIFEEGTVAASRTRTGDSLEGISPPLPCPSPLHSPTSALGLGLRTCCPLRLECHPHSRACSCKRPVSSQGLS